MTRIVSVGECMIELRVGDPWRATLAFGGDTLNALVYLRRELGDGDNTSFGYVTAVGDDRLSSHLIAAWEDLGISTSAVRRVAGSSCGLYVVNVDAVGERTFTYHRSRSAARQLFSGTEDTSALEGADIIFLSGISIGILPDPARVRLLESVANCRRAGSLIAFDSNYRPQLWAGREEAAEWTSRFLANADIALPTFDDHRALFGHDVPQQSIEHLRQLGVQEIAMKLSSVGSIVSSSHGAPILVSTTPVAEVVDTTSAGDAFDGGYLAARLRGSAPEEAAQIGNGWGALVIQHPGAIIPRELAPSGRGGA